MLLDVKLLTLVFQSSAVRMLFFEKTKNKRKVSVSNFKVFWNFSIFPFFACFPKHLHLWFDSSCVDYMYNKQESWDLLIYCRVSQSGVLEPQGVHKKFQGIQILTYGYANFEIGGMRIRKIIAWGYAKTSKVNSYLD